MKDEKIRVAGLHGGGLPLCNSDGDSLETMALDWPRVDILFQSAWASIYSKKDSNKCCKIYASDRLRVYGFSLTGNNFIVGTSSDLLIFKRKK